MTAPIGLNFKCECGYRLDPIAIVTTDAPPELGVSEVVVVTFPACPNCKPCPRATDVTAATRRAYEEGFQNGMSTFQGAEVV